MRDFDKDIYYCLGYGENTPDEATLRLIKEIKEEVLSDIEPAAVSGSFLLSQVELGGSDIAQHLKNAEKCILFAATLGAESERLSAAYQKTDMHSAVIFDCVCDAYIEAFADEYCDNLLKEYREKGLYINTRYSPGYGDFSVEYQHRIIDLLNCTRLIGLSVNSSSILIPRKSITAVMGIFTSPPQGKAMGCGSCNMNSVCKMKGKSRCLRQTDL